MSNNIQVEITELTKKSERLLSLDVFRGATIAAMLLVNNPGDWGNTFPPLLHAEWHGCTATDLIFPFFLFIMGIAMTFSFGKKQNSGADKGKIILSVIRRTLIIFALGCVITFFAWKGLRKEHYSPMGVLQRIALCYFFASIITLFSGLRGQILWTIALLVVHYVLLKFIPFPGHDAGVLDKFNNISDWFDTKILGVHLGEYNKELGIGHSAEGLMGTISAIASTLSGVLCGHWLRKTDRNGYEKVAGMMVIGTVLIAFAALFSYNIPFNKNLWTPSYVIHTTGWALLSLGLCYWIADLKGYKKWTKPFIVYGVNPITAYFGASLMAYTTVWIRWENIEGKKIMLKYFLYDHIYKSWVPYIFGNQISSACWGMTYVILWCVLMWILYNRKIFIKV